MHVLMVIDVGNTHVTVGVFSDRDLTATWRLTADSRRTDDEYLLLLAALLERRGVAPGDIDAVAICSVVPPLTEIVCRALTGLVGCEPMVVGHDTQLGLTNLYDRPQDVGADRLVDAVSAVQLYGGPAIVVDFGTATVFDAISAQREYLGGAISPGIHLAADALYQATSLLRRVDLDPPERAIGGNTTRAIQSGLLYGYVGLVEGMIHRFRAELSPQAPEGVKVIATGGLAAVIADHTDEFTHVDENLTLTGLRLVYERNR
ncbi:MAG: type III pantothenate kinase [Gammaproteobacteria bacterium]|nr:type III pantothenate kinase [Gammaproteobacteria bacterium]